MGRASKRKMERWVERSGDARKLRIVVCTYADRSLEPAAELLKAAVVYGDEVLLHSPTAVMLSSVASLARLSSGELVGLLREVGPALGEAGERLTEHLQQLGETHSTAETERLLGLMLDDSSGMRQIIRLVDPGAGAELDDQARQFARARQDLDQVVEEQLVAAGVTSVLPAIEAGLLQLVALEDTNDLIESYMKALWSVLRDPRYYPLFDAGIAGVVDAAVRAGAVSLSTGSKSRGRQASAASGFLARLPTFPRASMDEIIDIRRELEPPLVRFRAQLVHVAHGLDVDAFDPQFDEAAEDAWTSQVRPALLELEELVEEKRLRTQFGARLPTGGVFGSAGGLITGIITHAPMTGVGVAAGAAVAGAAAAAIADRARLEREIRRRPYYLLHRTEELLTEVVA